LPDAVNLYCLVVAIVSDVVIVMQ